MVTRGLGFEKEKNSKKKRRGARNDAHVMRRARTRVQNEPPNRTTRKSFHPLRTFSTRENAREIQNARGFRPKTSRRKKNERTKKKRRRRRRRRRGKKARTRWQFPRLRSRSRLARFFSIVVERTLLRFLCVCERVKCVFCARRKVPLIFEKNLL